MRLLRDVLPDHYVVIGNFELQPPRRKNTLEYDAVVIGDRGVFAVEIKGWGGKITGDIRRWQLPWGRVENPLIRTETKAKALRDYLVRRCALWPDDLYCESLVLLMGRKLKLNIEDPRANRLLTEATLKAFFTWHASDQGVLIDETLRDQILQNIAPVARQPKQSMVLRDYEIMAELERPHGRYREFIGRHNFLKTRKRVRIKSYELDPLMPKAQRDLEMRRVIRDLEALGNMEDSPYVARPYDVIRDMEDADILYLVSDWVGTQTLAEFMEANTLGIDDPELWSIGLHLLRAVSYIHEQSVVHRDLHPGVIFMTKDADEVPLKIADFDFARIARMDSIADDMLTIGTEGYVAPELWLADDEYDERVDIFSVGAILFELMSGVPLYDSELALLRQEEIWDRRKALVPDDALRACLHDLLSYDPNARATNLEQAQAFFSERLEALLGKSP